MAGVEREQLQVWQMGVGADGTPQWNWLGVNLDVASAMAAADKLYEAIMQARQHLSRQPRETHKP